jgi:AbrB family looped-hinge helix DNA binding protein
MATEGPGGDAEASGETTVSESYSATVPAAVRERIDLRPGDKLRWRVEDGELRVEIVHQREGVFDDLETVSAGVDVVKDHDLTGGQ